MENINFYTFKNNNLQKTPAYRQVGIPVCRQAGTPKYNSLKIKHLPVRLATRFEIFIIGIPACRQTDVIWSL